MTRPQAIAPITFHDQKMYYIQRIDVAPFLPPKPRTITLEPLSSRSRAKRKPRSTDLTKLDEAPSDTIPTPSMPATPRSEANPLSTSPSTQSLDSRPSENCATSTTGSLIPVSVATDSRTASDGHSPNSKRSRTITATVESLRGGCLRGDSISLKVVVHHNKPIKSIYGIIVTLYRQARVDMHPVIPLGPTTEGQKKRYEDYYPKSMTGLGGLSLSGAGSSHVFRKDLVQVVMPLMVDPITLMAEVGVKLGMPEDAFPTISTCPGGMISFQYNIEVILDIRGKLAGIDRLSPQTNGMSHSGNQQSSLQDMLGYPASDRSGHHLYGQAIIDTAPIRRDKNVVTCVLEIIVGTKDSERAKAKGKARMIEDDGLRGSGQQASLRSLTVRGQSSPILAKSVSGPSTFDHQTPSGDQWTRNVPEHLHNPSTPDYQSYPHHPDHNHPPYDYLAAPEVFEEDLSEKERLRRAEALLMPSQPPDAGHDSIDAAIPSAPVLEEESGYGVNGFIPAYVHAEEDAFSPEYEYHHIGGEPSRSSHQHDDKEELRREQLESQASAPQDGETQEDPGYSGVQQTPDAPSFPQEEDLHPVHNGTWNGDEYYMSDNLPRYER